MKPNESVVLTLRVPVKDGERLERFAKRNGWTLAEAAAHLVEEGLKHSEPMHFRDSPGGRMAYVERDSLTAAELISLVRSFDDDLSAVAWHLGWSEFKVRAAVDYAEISEGNR